MMSAKVWRYSFAQTCPLHNLLSHAYTGEKKVTAGHGGKKRMTQNKKHKVKISKALKRGKEKKEDWLNQNQREKEK